MKYRILYLILVLCTLPRMGRAQVVAFPSVDPQAKYTTVEGEETDDATTAQSAPLVARFTANPSNLGLWTARYEWKIYRPGEEQAPLVHRFDEDIDYTFTESGSFYVQLYATFVLGTDTIAFPEEGEASPIQVTISESKLEFPNAFSPNGDGFNDVYKAKDSYQSIVSFQATVFSRWGQKIYSWDSPSGSWDGRWNGHTVKDGVYYLVVNARGADGHKYNIRKAINVITGYNNDSQGDGSGEE
ncbi:MAG: gliding motility-associated C-terminal domain-containing protein [Bacteroidaceae bacterium]|nr:gliding motility-associated C-terminal domain-containing protein [Bacteroidaceae bacterium]